MVTITPLLVTLIIVTNWLTIAKIVKLVKHNKKLKQKYDCTRGLWCVDKDPSTVSIQWIRDNCFQLMNTKL